MQPSYEMNQPLQQPYIHLSDYLAILKRRKWVVILFFFFLVSTVAVVSLSARPVYQASSKIIIEAPSSPVSGLGAQRIGRDADQQEFLQTQYQLLQSRELARRVVEKLELWKEFEAPAADKGQPGTVGKLLSWIFPESNSKESSPSQVSGAHPDIPFIIDSYLANLVITPIRGTQLVDVGYSEATPERAALIADAHARAFIDLNVEKSHADAQQRLQWLDAELKKQKSKVEASLEALHAYQQKNNIVALNERQTMISQKLADINSALTKATAEMGTNQAAFEELQRLAVEDNTMLSLPEISQDEIVKNLHNQLELLKSQKSELAATYGPEHPKMIEIDSHMRQVEKEIDKEIERLRRLLESNRSRSLTVASGLKQQLEAAKSEAMALQEKQIADEVLTRDAESNQKLYDILLAQAKEIGLLSAFDSNNVRVVESARIPLFPARPRIFLNILLAVVLGLFMGTGFAFFVEYMDNTVKTAEDTQLRLGLSVLGSIPYEKALARHPSPALLLPGDAGRAQQNAGLYPVYHHLAGRLPAKIYFTQPGMPGQVLLLESAAMGEGKTTVAGCLAATLGRAGLRVLAMDCDFQRPALHHVFEIENKRGLTSAMAAILTFKLDAGNLDDCPVSDLFALIGLRKQSGQLTINNTDQSMTAIFQGGQLLHLENSQSPIDNRLGAMLLRGGFLTEDQLTEALERNRRTGQPLGYILVNAGYLSRDRLQGPLKLQMEEQLQMLFSWRHGTFTFYPGVVNPYEEERICFCEDYSGIIARLSRTSASKLLTEQILAEVQPVKEQNVFVLPAGPAGRIGPENMINYALLAHLLDTLKQRFDVVLLDAPPLLEIANLNALSTLADGVVLVVKAGHLKVKTLNQATGRLAEANAKILGAILNQVKS